MRRKSAFTGLIALAVVWAATAVFTWGQSGLSKVPSGETPAAPNLPPSGPPPVVEFNCQPPAVSLELVPVTADVPGKLPDKPPEKAAGGLEATLSLEWVKPDRLRVGQPAEIALVVRNPCPAPAQEVVVRTQFPDGLKLQEADPRANVEGNVWWWDLGMVAARQEKRLRLRVVPAAGGSLTGHAWVTFTGSSALKLQVGEPRLSLMANAPDSALLGSPVVFSFTVANTGDAPAERVRLRAGLSEGLENAGGKSVAVDVGKLTPGETRTVPVSCVARAGGAQQCEGTVEGAGATAQVKAGVVVVVPRLNLEISGPKVRYLNRKAVYRVRVVNPTEVPIPDVTVQAAIPPGFKVRAASDGGRVEPAAGSVAWAVGELKPYQAREMKVEAVAVALGDFRCRATAQGAHGLKVDGEAATRVEGMNALLLEVVDTEDPIEVGAETTYEVRVTNTGAKTEGDVRLVCTVPDKMQFRAATGPTPYRVKGQEVVFDPLPPLAPRGEATFRVTVKGAAAGNVRFKAQLTSANVQEPLVEMESTLVYAD